MTYSYSRLYLRTRFITAVTRALFRLAPNHAARWWHWAWASLFPGAVRREARSAVNSAPSDG